MERSYDDSQEAAAEIEENKKIILFLCERSNPKIVISNFNE